MNTEIYYCLLEIACKGMLPRYLSHSNPTDYIYQIQHCANMLAQQTPHWLVSLKDTAPCAWKHIGYINVMVCLGYLNLLFAKMPCRGMLGHYFTPGLFQGKCGCLPASSRPRCSSLLPHPRSPILLYLLTSWGLLFLVLRTFVCLFFFKLCTKIRNWSISRVHDCSRAGNNPALHKWTSYLGQRFLRHSPVCYNRWALLRALGSMMFFFKQKWLYKYSAKRPLTLKYILSAIKYTVFVPQYQVGCSRKQ